MFYFSTSGYQIRFSCGVSLMLLLLVACGNNYQAPVDEQSERLLIGNPIIVASSQGDTSFDAPQSRARVASSSTARASVAAMTTPGLRHASSETRSLSHRVRPGDTLYSIAFEYDLDARNLAIANNLSPPYTIFIEQQLNLDLSRISNIAPRAAADTSNLGAAVRNNSVAQAQAVRVRSGGVSRQAIDNSRSPDPDWQWPHTGRVLRAFQAGNKGIDIGGRPGDPVWAASDGEVVYSGNGIQGTGNLIIIRHGDSYLSAYAHNSVMLVSKGSRVTAGDKIAEIGENSTGVPMLHFEIRVDGNSVNPIRFLPKR